MLLCVLIDLNLCQPLLSRQPGRYQVCLTPIQKATQFYVCACLNLHKLYSNAQQVVDQ